MDSHAENYNSASVHPSRTTRDHVQRFISPFTVGSILQAVITSIKGQLGLFVEVLPDREMEGLVHLTEISAAIQELVRRVRGRPDQHDILKRELEKQFQPNDRIWVKVLKFKVDRGKTVADLTLIDVPQSGRRSRARMPSPESIPSPDGLRARYQSGVSKPGTGPVPSLFPPTAPDRVDDNADIAQLRSLRAGHITSSRGKGDKLPKLFTIVEATIINAFHDGIFVKIPGCEVDGLVHHTQISRSLNIDNRMPKVERYKAIMAIIGGEVNRLVWVQVVYVSSESEHLKCECSLKMVSQRDGRELDPDHKMWLKYMQQRRSMGAGFMHPEMREEMESVQRQLRLKDAEQGREEHEPRVEATIATKRHREGPMDISFEAEYGDALTQERKHQRTQPIERSMPGWRHSRWQEAAGEGTQFSPQIEDPDWRSADPQEPQEHGYPPQEHAYAPQEHGLPPQDLGYPPQELACAPQEHAYSAQYRAYSPHSSDSPGSQRSASDQPRDTIDNPYRPQLHASSVLHSGGQYTVERGAMPSHPQPDPDDRRTLASTTTAVPATPDAFLSNPDVKRLFDEAVAAVVEQQLAIARERGPLATAGGQGGKLGTLAHESEPRSADRHPYEGGEPPQGL